MPRRPLRLPRRLVGNSSRNLRVAAIGVMGLAGACAWGLASIAAHPRVSTALTWRADIKPLFDRQCVSCHAANAADTVALATYDQVRPWIAAIREEVLERRMPVPRGRPGIDPGVDDHPLSPMERDIIIGWIDGGAPEGRSAATAAASGSGDPEAPAATFWCRMHPEIRADRAGVCPLCRMELAAFTPDLARRYAWSVDADTRRRRLGLRIADAATGAAVREFEQVHEYPLHLFVVSEDFRDFQHVHPVMDVRGEWTVPWRAPARGRYWVFGDFLPSGGAPQMLQRIVTVTRGTSTPPPSSSSSSPSSPSTTSTLNATLTTSTPTLRTGDEARITIILTDAKTGEPAGDLQSYLGAWGHLFVLHEGRDEAMHAHPDSAGTTPGGPIVAFDVLFPRPGTYHLWMQVQRRGDIITLPFVVRVSPRV